MTSNCSQMRSMEASKVYQVDFDRLWGPMDMQQSLSPLLVSVQLSDLSKWVSGIGKKEDLNVDKSGWYKGPIKWWFLFNVQLSFPFLKRPTNLAHLLQ